MLSFKQFIKEDTEPHEWKNKTPRGMEEHNEVQFQLNDHEKGNVQWHPDIVHALRHLTKPENFRTALKKATKETRTKEQFKNIGNHEVGKSLKQLSKDLEPGKWKRAKKGNTPPGIVLSVTNHVTGKRQQHALAGASNMAVTTARNEEEKTGHRTPVLVIHHSINKN